MIVVDVNVLVYANVASAAAGSAAASDLAVAVRKRDSEWVAPAFWRSEFRNVLFGYLRRGHLTFDEALEAQVGAELSVETQWVGSRQILELAVSSRASAYDCEYVALARALRAPLVTADRKLVEAFPEDCVSLWDYAA